MRRKSGQLAGFRFRSPRTAASATASFASRWPTCHWEALYLKTREPVVREGVPVRVALALPYSDGPRFCTLAGQVVRVDRDAQGRLRGMGVSFTEDQIAAVDRSTLKTFLTNR